MRANLEPAVSLGCVTIGEKHVVYRWCIKQALFTGCLYTNGASGGCRGTLEARTGISRVSGLGGGRGGAFRSSTGAFRQADGERHRGTCRRCKHHEGQDEAFEEKRRASASASSPYRTSGGKKVCATASECVAIAGAGGVEWPPPPAQAGVRVLSEARLVGEGSASMLATIVESALDTTWPRGECLPSAGRISSVNVVRHTSDRESGAWITRKLFKPTKGSLVRSFCACYMCGRIRGMRMADREHDLCHV